MQQDLANSIAKSRRKKNLPSTLLHQKRNGYLNGSSLFWNWVQDILVKRFPRNTVHVIWGVTS